MTTRQAGADVVCLDSHSLLIITLALLAALLDFTPNFGPVVSAVPAMLVALTNGPEQTLWAGGLYLAVQVVES